MAEDKKSFFASLSGILTGLDDLRRRRREDSLSTMT